MLNWQIFILTMLGVAALAYFALPYVRYMDRHPQWFQQWQLGKREHEHCPRCHKRLPVGFLAALKDQREHDIFGKLHPGGSLFVIEWDDHLDGDCLMGGGFCGLCSQFYSLFEEDLMRPERRPPQIKEFMR